MKKVVFLVFVLLNCNYSFCQVEEAPPPPPPAKEMIEEEPEFIDQDVEEETIVEDRPVFVDESYGDSSASYNSKYRSNNPNSKYQTTQIYEGFELVYERFGNDSYSRDYGVLKRGEMILPIIFKASNYYSKKKQIILGIERTYGLFNLETEKWDIPIEYSSLSLLAKNLYIAKQGMRAGIVDENNNIVTDFNWSSISAISGLENYVYVNSQNSSQSRKGIYSIIANKLTVSPKYKMVDKINDENYFKVKNEFDEFNIIDINDKPRFKKWYKELTAAKGGRKYYIVKNEGKMGVIDENENTIVPLEYQFIKNYPYNDGSYLAQNKKGKFGCITIDGNETLPFEYDNLDVMGYSNMVISGKGNKCGIVQVNNGLPFEIATCDFDDISKNSKVFIVKQDGKYGVMDLYGKMKTEMKYNEIISISNDLLIAKENGGATLMNNNGEVLTSKKYKEIIALMDQQSHNSYYSNKKFSYLQVLNNNNKYGIIDKLGNELVGPIFEDLLSESNNVVQAKSNGKIGLYNILTKKEILPFEYDQITYSKKGYFAFKGNDIYLIKDPGKMKIVKL